MATLDDDLAKAVTEGFRLAQSSIINQDLILSGTGDVTVTLADGSKKTGPSWTKLIAQAGAAGASAAAAKASETNALASKNAAAQSATNAATSEGNALASKNAAKTSETNAKTSENNAKTSENNSAASASSAAASLAAAQLLTSVPYEAPPFPDVWAPLNDDLRLLAGFAPYDKLTISGQVLELPTKSMTFSRATTATYINKSGVLQTANINEPRFESEGLLMEGASTNLILYSNDPSKWSPLNVAIASTNNLAPDGTLTAAKVNISNANSTNLNLGASVASYAAFTTGGYITSTFFMKAGERSLVQMIWSGGATGISSKYANFDLINGVVNGNCYAYSMQQLANGWWRCSATALIEGDMTAAAANGAAWMGIIDSMSDGRRPFVMGTIGDGVYVWGAHTEAQAIPTSYIPTNGAAATRAKESLTLTPVGNIGYNAVGDFFNRTVSFEISVSQYMNPVGYTYFRMLQAYGVSYDILMQLHTGYISSYRTGSNTSPVISIAYPFSRKIFTQTIDSNNTLTAYFNDQIGSRTGAPNIAAGVPSSIVADSNASVVYHIRNFRIWHRLLTQNQVKGLR